MNLTANPTASSPLRDRLESDWQQLSTQEMCRLDQLCDRFEHALVSASGAEIESFVADLDVRTKQCVLPELILIEWQIRRSRGEQIDAESYKKRFPEFAKDIEDAQVEFTADDAIPGDTWTGSNHHSSHARGTLKLRSAGGLTPGYELGHYRIEAELGRGGMGHVYRVHDLRLHRDGAVKVLSADAVRRDNAKERFLREARSAAVVRHPNVVTIYSVEEFDGVPVLAMELVEGETLDAFLRRSGRLSPRDAALIGVQIASGLAAAHQRGMIHRDVKPANILLDHAHPTHSHDGSVALPFTVKITDFGLARAAAELDLTNQDVIVGTPQFMSPEQARGDKADHRSDLFALGSLLYNMLTGRMPFQGETVPGTLHKVIHEQPESLANFDTAVPEELNRIVLRLLSKSPSDRFQSASEVAMRLRTAVERTSATSSGRSYNATRRGVVIGLLIAPVLAAILCAIFLIRTENSEFTLVTDDPDVVAAIDRKGGILVQDRATKAEYKLRRGKNRFPEGTYDLEVVGPDNIEITTPSFTLKRGAEIKATVTVRRFDKPKGQETWSDPVLLKGGINSEISEQHPTITSDLLTLLFIRNGQIWQSIRNSTEVDFSEPVLLQGEVNDGLVDSPYVTGDGLTLCFASNRPGTLGMNDLWIARRPSRSEAFGTPEPIRGPINSVSEESTPYISDNLLTLIYCAQPSEGAPVDLYRAERSAVDEPFGKPERFHEQLNGSRFDFFPRLTSDGKQLFFTTNSFGKQEIRTATWNAETRTFENPVPLPDEIQIGLVGAAAVSGNGQVMIFDSARDDGIGGFDLWITTRL